MRARWAAHIADWQREGGRQADYARRQGLAPGLFSLWKCRLAKLGASAEHDAPSLIPVTVKRKPSATATTTAAPTSTTLHARLPNGLSVEIEVGSPSALPGVLAELAALRC